ncbi:MAG: hypothetical protein AAB066_02525, partial [Candidatus Margulisiibacteriota bacterium]
MANPDPAAPIISVAIPLSVTPKLSVTITLILNGPLTEGVPLITPVFGSRINPVGNPVAAYVYGPVPPVAANTVLYGVFCVAPGNVL